MRVCVFGSSSQKTPESFVDAAFDLGRLIAKNKFICVNGGGASGVMGALNRGCRSLGGEIIGVIHQKFCVDADEDRMIKNMIVCKGEDLEERKRLLLENGDCLLVMPGGVGTFDELWDAVSSKSLNFKGLMNKPIVIVNIDGFYDGFIAQLNRAFKEKLLYGTLESYFHVSSTIDDALKYCADEVTKSQGSELDSGLDSKPRRLQARVSSETTSKARPWEPATFLAGLAIGVVVSYFLHRR